MNSPRHRSPRRPLPELPADLHQHRNLAKWEFAAMAGISEKKVDEMVYGNKKRGIPPRSGPPSFTIGRRRLWRLREVLKWIDKKAKEAGR